MSVFIGFPDRSAKGCSIQSFLFQDNGKSLLLKGSGIKDLISAAYGGGKGDQDVGLAQCKDLADRVGTSPGQHQVCGCEEVS